MSETKRKKEKKSQNHSRPVGVAPSLAVMDKAGLKL